MLDVIETINYGYSLTRWPSPPPRPAKVDQRQPRELPHPGGDRPGPCHRRRRRCAHEHCSISSRAQEVGRRDPKKAALSGWIGSALEYYDFALYSLSAALVFPTVFFPSGNATLALIGSLATYAVGYFARPIGAVVLGA